MSTFNKEKSKTLYYKVIYMKSIVFSGGCFSGKTTAINYLKNYLESQGKIVGVSEECMRPFYKEGETIDSIRSDFERYLNFEIDMIKEKIKVDTELINSNNFDYVLIDRSLTDSLFYYTFYVDKSKFTKEHWKTYSDFYKELDSEINKFCKLYDVIIQFKPLDYTKCNDDKFRPKNLVEIGNCEWHMINTFNKAYQFEGKMITIDFNNMPLEKIVNYI